MSPFDLLLTALGGLLRRPFRTALATLGIICGVASVQAMLSIGEGAKRETLAAIARMGLKTVVVRTVEADKRADAVPDPNDPRYGLGLVDAEHLRRHVPGVQRLAGVRDLQARLYNRISKPVEVTVLAAEPDFLDLARARISAGRSLHALDEAEHRRVCVVGARAARDLFLLEDPLTQSVFLDGQWFQVVGVLSDPERLGAVVNAELERCVLVPLSTALANRGTPRSGSLVAADVRNAELDALVVELAGEAAVVPAACRLARWLDTTGRAGEYEMQVPLALLRQQTRTRSIFSVVMASIAGISLMVGGIGIMNIMLANVSERRREIGVRRALGARRRDIHRQFALEAMALTGLGGLAGLASGHALSVAVARWAGWPAAVTPLTLLLGLGAAILTGLAFGWWPARQAASVDPIEALRGE